MTQTEQSFKKKTLSELSKQFESWGFTDIRTPHLPEKHLPTRTVSGFHPDMTFKKHNVLFIVEVVSGGVLENDGNFDKWLVYSDRAKDVKGCFWILVPEGCKVEFVSKINDLYINASVHEL
ncbi:MAG: hypothetical protein HW380_3049 [Magnetococcales bacterium]|nr:hypothetical protein [Magnetococcales bacterium]HIJ84080.1 hypothetical protein [Magnetococcales bacterium]